MNRRGMEKKGVDAWAVLELGAPKGRAEGLWEVDLAGGPASIAARGQLDSEGWREGMTGGSTYGRVERIKEQGIWGYTRELY